MNLFQRPYFQNLSKTVLFLFIVISSMSYFSVPVIYADSGNAVISSERITLNEQIIDNESAKYPFLLYRNITYVPMTYHLCRFLGLETNWDDSARALSIEKASRTFPYVPDADGNNKTGEAVAVSAVSYPVMIDGISSDQFDSTWPLLNYKGITYFPLTWEYAVTMFGWNYKWDAVNGLEIRSKIDLREKDKRSNEYTSKNADFDRALDILTAHYTSDREYTGILRSSDGKINKTFASKVLCETSPHGLFVKFSADPFPFFKNGVGIQAGYYDRKPDSKAVISISGTGEMLEMQEATIEFENSELGYLAQCLTEFQFSGSRISKIKEFKQLSKDGNTAVWELSVINAKSPFHGYDAEFAVDLKHDNVKYIKIRTPGYTLKMDTVKNGYTFTELDSNED